MINCLSEERKRQVLELCRELIRIRSYSGKEWELAGKLEDFFL